MDKIIVQFVMLLIVFWCSVFMNLKAGNEAWYIGIPTFLICFYCVITMIVITTGL